MSRKLGTCQGVKGTEYSVAGWKRDKIFPDFLVRMENENGVCKFQFVETKGDHLEGNKDTKYKQTVFDYLNSLAKKEFSIVGEFNLMSPSQIQLSKKYNHKKFGSNFPALIFLEFSVF